MGAREVIELPKAYIEVEARPGYLFVVESGALTRVSHVQRYTARIDAIGKRTDCSKALIDARGEVGDPTEEVREAMWAWLTSPDRVFEFVAFVLPTEMAVARVNMTALSRRAPLRAFESVQAGQRWLLRDPKVSTANTQPRVQSSPPDGETIVKSQTRRQRPSPGLYRSAEVPTDHVVTPPDGVKRGGGGPSGNGGSQVA